ncbi:phosphatase PAP2 family protein [Aurantiacibacter sediminis]|uniref:Phosphatase PAP2 family protein n=1 Tax=Aurantiacibacter sediminis TaxID=2793064 RepID=A0ABS0N4C6_9SPHN|nr:phosphatase PAP2 family protein [Aurantiacibacter sediminis]MBH5322802.1 phosphatase PAP2 family protein [Aurantiacibacter sediminis]
MLTLSRPLAATIIIVASLLPTVVAIAFFGGHAGLWYAPFSPRVLTIALTASLLVLWQRVRSARLEGEPKGALEVLRDDPIALLIPAILIVLITFASAGFSFIKANIADYVPYYLDPPFVDADRILFFGHDPWRVSHAIFGTWGTIALDRLYVLWFLLFPFLAIFIGGSADRTFQFRAMIGVLVVLILLGNVMAVSMSSVGPIFYEYFYGDAYYAELMARLYTANDVAPLSAIRLSDYLIEMYETDAFGTGISAMPSVHVGFAVLSWLIVKDCVKARWAHRVAGSYAFLIWIGSFHLAWHYAWDGIVSAAVVIAAWKLLAFVEVAPRATESKKPRFFDLKAREPARPVTD